MNSTEKANLYNNTLHKIEELLKETDTELGNMESLSILSSIVEDYDLQTASNLIKFDCEPDLTKDFVEGNLYSDGNKNAGYIPLDFIIETVTEIVNCDDSTDDIEFQYFVREETDAEAEENEHEGDCVTWYVKDESADIKNLNIQYEILEG